MNPDEFFKKHPSLKEELKFIHKLEEKEMFFESRDIARTQTDNAIINMVFDDIIGEQKNTIVSPVDVVFVLESLRMTLFSSCTENRLLPIYPCVVRVDDLKRAMDKVGEKIGFYLNPADASNTCWYYAVLEELGLGDDK